MESRPGGLSLEEVLRLQRELYAAYSDDDFQAQLEEIEAKHGKAYQKYTGEHTRLFLTVQDRVLPKYGFATGQKGVVQMLDDVKRFNGNKTFEQNRLELNRLIGLAPEAPEPREEPQPPQRRAAAAPPPAGRPAPALAAAGAEPMAPSITELLRWQPHERRSLRPEAGAGAEAPAPERPPAAAPASAPRGGAGRGGAGAAPRGAGAPAPAPAAAAPAAAAAARGPGGAAAAAGAGQDVGAWLRSLDDPGLAQYEPFVRRQVGSADEIKRRYPLLQDFFAAVPVNDPRDRQAFAKAIRTLPEPS